jgi:hypothetical protein
MFPLRSDDVVHFPAGEQTCLHHLDSGEYYMLNEAAAFVWDRCGGERSVAEIATDLATQYEVEADVALADTLEVVQELTEQECLVPASQ